MPKLVTSFTCTPSESTIIPSAVTLAWMTTDDCTAAILSGVGVVDTKQPGLTLNIVRDTTFTLTAFAGTRRVVETVSVTAKVAPVVPDRLVSSGTIVSWGGSVQPPPKGWLLCDGAKYGANQYPLLYAVIKNQYGGTPGVDFAVPNLNNRFIMGASGHSSEAAQTSADSDNHTHTIPAFSNRFTTGASGKHSHGFSSDWYTNTLTSGGHSCIGVSTDTVGSTSEVGDHTHSAEFKFSSFTSDIQTTGDSSRAVVRPPWFALYYIIKI
jgi:microcystin-dependent protein